jgi:hypothetical protein
MPTTPALHKTQLKSMQRSMEMLLLSSLTYARTQTLSPCFASTSFTYKTMALLGVSVISKNPMVEASRMQWN